MVVFLTNFIFHFYLFFSHSLASAILAVDKTKKSDAEEKHKADVKINQDGIALCKDGIKLKTKEIQQIQEDEEKLKNLRLEKIGLEELLNCMRLVATLSEHDSLPEVQKKLETVEANVKVKKKENASCLSKIKEVEQEIEVFVQEGATVEANTKLQVKVEKLNKNIKKRQTVIDKFKKLRNDMMDEIEKGVAEGDEKD